MVISDTSFREKIRGKNALCSYDVVKSISNGFDNLAAAYTGDDSITGRSYKVSSLMREITVDFGALSDLSVEDRGMGLVLGMISEEFMRLSRYLETRTGERK